MEEDEKWKKVEVTDQRVFKPKKGPLCPSLPESSLSFFLPSGVYPGPAGHGDESRRAFYLLDIFLHFSSVEKGACVCVFCFQISFTNRTNLSKQAVFISRRS